jgi:hypothetical protein
MENTPRLYDTLVAVLRQHRKWLDLRHLKTLAWMMVGLIQSGSISLDAWVPYIHSRATYAQSTVRRFRRWLDNPRIEVHPLYGPLMQQALSEWGQYVLYLALDTSLLWDRYCIVRISVIYRGRAIPIIWQVLEHSSSSVAYGVYRNLLNEVATLLPLHSQVVFLADRGFADTQLMQDLKRLGWHWRIRIKSIFYVYRRGQRGCQVGAISVARGQARFLHHVHITAHRFGPVHLALARPQGTNEHWFVVSDEPTDVRTFDEYGLRFDIEENFLDDKSNGFQLESSLIRSDEALSRLCFVLAMTTLYLVSQGTEVVKQGKRRWVDSHWFRGKSYFKIGWDWVKAALSKGFDLITRLHLSGEPDPEPAIASKSQVMRQPPLRFSVDFATYA